MNRITRVMDIAETPPEPVTDYETGEENLYLRGLSGVWYCYKVIT